MRRIWAGPRPFALLRVGVRLSRGPLTLPCCAPLPSVVPFPSFPHSPDTPAAERDDHPALRPTSFRSLRQRGAPFIAPASLFTRLAMAPVAVFGRPTLPQTTRTRPAQFRCVGCALLRRLRSIRPAHPPHRFSCRALPPAAQPTHHLPGASGRSPTIPPQQVLTPAHPAARFPMVSQPPHRQPTAPLPGRARPEKGPTPPVSPP